MKNIKTLLFAIVLLLSTISCNNYLDINKNPNSYRFEDVKPDQILPGALLGAYRVQSGLTSITLGNYFMQNWYQNIYGYSGIISSKQYTFRIDNTFYDGIWDNYYRNLKNVNDIIVFDGNNYDNHKAVALIIKSFYMQTIVDLYGDAPYSEAFLGGENINPAYDDDKEIYASLIENVNVALDLFDNADSSDATLGAEDIVYGGDIAKWKAFGNFVKLKLLVRESEVADAAFLTQQFTLLNASNSFPTEAVTINPGFNTSNDLNMNPYYDSFYTSAGLTEQNTFELYRASGFIADFLNGEASDASFLSSDIVDPRREYLYELIGGKVVGVSQGIGSDAQGLPTSLSKIKLVAYMNSATSDGYIVTLPEIKFLLAEAIHKGYLTSGDAKAEFDAGITASFAQLGAPIGTYLTDIDSKANLGWNGGNPIAAIMAQKWLATNNSNSIEAYIDFTRTGFPKLPLPVNASYPNRPYRLQYPVSEFTANSANVPIIQQAELFNVASAANPFWVN